jgi:hypothetical protein
MNWKQDNIHVKVIIKINPGPAGSQFRWWGASRRWNSSSGGGDA